MNGAYIAHIVAASKNGPRGGERSASLRRDFSNLMLLCDFHHRMIDVENVAGHPEALLKAMKDAHERRIAHVTDVQEDRQSHAVIYEAPIGSSQVAIADSEWLSAMAPARYPRNSFPIRLGSPSSRLRDGTSTYWEAEAEGLRQAVITQLRPTLQQDNVKHVSIFGFAPQPLLILLGSLIPEATAGDVFHRRKEPPGWGWVESKSEPLGIRVTEPIDGGTGDVALVLGVSADVSHERIRAVVGEQMPIWSLTVEKPHNDCLRHPCQVEEFRTVMRPTFDKIRERHGQNIQIHVFPALPLSLAIELGRIHNPKAHPSLALYDQIDPISGFAFAFLVSKYLS